MDQQKSAKIIAIISVIVVLLVIVGGIGAFFFIKNQQTGTTTTPGANGLPNVLGGGGGGAPSPSATTIETVYRDIRDSVTTGRGTHALKPDNFGTYMLQNLKTSKVCPKDALVEGCWDKATQGVGGSETGQPGAVLQNGATLVGLDNGVEVSQGVWCNGIWIDWNGAQAPNVYGEDQFNVIIAYGERDGQDWCKGVSAGQVQIKPDQVRNKINTALGGS